MNELQLVGYTADLRHLVLSDAAGASRFRVPVDDDFIATVEEVVALARPGTAFLEPEDAEPPPPPAPAPEPPQPAGPRPGEGALAAAGVLARRRATPQDEAQQQGSRLSPREIQALLRSGKTARAVAKLAGTDEGMILRWLPPIEAERDQVLQGVWRQRVSKARLGPSRDLLGDAVARNLGSKGVAADDEDVRWTVSRRDGDDVWTVELRYRSRGRSHRALWRFDPESDALEPRNDLATEIAWTRPRRGTGKASVDGRDDTAAAPPQEAPDDEGSAETGTAKRSLEKAASKKAAARKSTAKKKAAAKKSTAKKKAAAKKSTAKKKATAKKSTARKSAAKKAAVPRATSAAPPRKVAAKKVLIRRPTSPPPSRPPRGDAGG